ncbi:MAG TPA: hypothetical protein PKC43_03950 [Phycisphaerales bacterium]|nr:hypothetical protein [Phycisphaerales bacterium]HMP36580.1 hypothetical protein [Phycisphaerales bacterium]
MLGSRLAARFLRVPLAVLALAGSIGASAAGQAPDPEESAIAQLRKATVFRPNGLHHALLLALRDLRDPAMRPFFESLVQAEHWSIQLDAILGLAELSDKPLIDPWLLGRLRDERDRVDALKVVLQLGMLDRERIEWLLANQDTPAVGRVLLMAELFRLGGAPDEAGLDRLAANPDPVIAGLASLVLGQIEAARGTPPSAAGAIARFARVLEALPPAERDSVIEELSTAARRYGLSAAIDLFSFRVTGEPEAPGPQESVVGMALVLDRPRGVELWKKVVGHARPTDEDARRADQARRVRFGLILLLNAAGTPPETFDLLPGTTDAAQAESLLLAMAAAGKAVASGTDPAPAMIALYDSGHRRSARWVVEAAAALDLKDSRRVYRHILEPIGGRTPPTPERRNDAIDAAARLAVLDPQTLREILAAAEDDGPLQEVILLGLANAQGDATGDLAASVRRIGMGRADSIALLVIARDAARPGSTRTLTDAELRQLGIIAGGGGGVDETLRAQAAWLYLRLSGRLDRALPKLSAAP